MTRARTKTDLLKTLTPSEKALFFLDLKDLAMVFAKSGGIDALFALERVREFNAQLAPHRAGFRLPQTETILRHQRSKRKNRVKTREQKRLKRAQEIRMKEEQQKKSDDEGKEKQSNEKDQGNT